MHRFSETFAKYCAGSFDLNIRRGERFRSLSVCILDCVYSLRAKYELITLPILQRYADAFLGGDIYAAGDTASDLIDHINSVGGPQAFANLVKNHQKLGGGSIPKEETVLQMATYLKLIRVETIEDFAAFESPKLMEAVLRAVDGISDAGANYMFMLAGDTGRVKPDVHIHHCIRDACGEDVNNADCQTIYSEAVALLHNDYPDLTVSGPDSIVWQHYAQGRNLR